MYYNINRCMLQYGCKRLLEGYGFIGFRENEDIFVHYSAILSEGYKTLIEGQYVKFDLVRTDKGLQAKNVVELKAATV